MEVMMTLEATDTSVAGVMPSALEVRNLVIAARALTFHARGED